MMKNKIPQFTTTDFTTTDKPYKFVYETEKDQHESTKQLVCENAKSVGIKNFNKLYSHYSKLKMGVPSSAE